MSCILFFQRTVTKFELGKFQYFPFRQYYEVFSYLPYFIIIFSENIFLTLVEIADDNI